MKKNVLIKFISILLLIIILVSLIPGNISIAATTDLITLGTGSYKITLTTDSTVEDIVKILGEPKLVTKSVFGGDSFTFYTDSNYSNYLYIETTADEKIISYGTVEPGYTTSTYSYGDDYPYYENKGLYGCLFSDSGTVKAGIYYNKSAMSGGNYRKIIQTFKTNYPANEIEYLKGLSQQSILMYNALSTKLGNRTELVFNEEMFYMNQQLKEFGSSIREYMFDLDKKEDYMKGIGVKENIELSNSIYYLLNPLQLASLANQNKQEKFGEKNVAVFDYDSDRLLLTAIAISEDALEYDKNRLDIELTRRRTKKIKFRKNRI